MVAFTMCESGTDMRMAFKELIEFEDKVQLTNLQAAL
jgi:hypothetical protein